MEWMDEGGRLSRWKDQGEVTSSYIATLGEDRQVEGGGREKVSRLPALRKVEVVGVEVGRRAWGAYLLLVGVAMWRRCWLRSW